MTRVEEDSAGSAGTRRPARTRNLPKSTARRDSWHPWLGFLRAASHPLMQPWPLPEPKITPATEEPVAEDIAHAVTKTAALELLEGKSHGVR